MGINNLHGKLLNFVSRPSTQVALCCGKTRFFESDGIDHECAIRVALDISSWIQSAIFGFSGLLVDLGQLTNHGRAVRDDSLNSNDQAKHREFQFVQSVVDYLIDKLHRLRDESGVRALVVLDGASPPAKKDMSYTRKRRRQQANDIYNNVDARMEDRVGAIHRAGCSKEIYRRIVNELIKAMKIQNFFFIVAPYEADAELAFLSRNKLVDLVITEDSDLVALGAGNVMFKFQHETQMGNLLRRRDLYSTSASSVDLTGFSDSMITVLCVASGCDYCANLKNVGIVSACGIIREAFLSKSYSTETAPTLSPLEKVFRGLFQKTSLNLSENEKADYIDSFLNALIMFQHPVVFDPLSEKCILLNDPFIDNNIDNDLALYKPYKLLCQDKVALQNIVGSIYDSVMARNIASGWINPSTFTLRYSDKNTPFEAQKIATATLNRNRKESSVTTSNRNPRDADERSMKENFTKKACCHFATQDSATSSASKFYPSQHVLTQHSLSTSPASAVSKHLPNSQTTKLSSLSSSPSLSMGKLSSQISICCSQQNYNESGIENLSPNEFEIDLPLTQVMI